MKRQFTLVEANFFYLILGVLLITLGFYAQYQNTAIGLLITEYVLLLLPVLIYAKATKMDFKETFKLKKISLKSMIMIFCMFIVFQPIVSFVNNILFLIYKYIGFPVVETPVIQMAENIGFAQLLFLVAITPAICEEIVFRGMILNGYENGLGKRRALLMSALLFAVFHFNFQNLLSLFLLGLLMGYVVQVTGSIYAGMIGHFANNGIATFLIYLYYKLQEYYIESGMGAEFEMAAQETEMTLSVFLVLFVIATVCFILFKYLVKVLKQDNIVYEENGIVIISEKSYNIVSTDGEQLLLLPSELAEGEYALDEVSDYIRQVSYSNLKLINPPYTSQSVEEEMPMEKPGIRAFIPLIIAFAIYVGFVAFNYYSYFNR